jgi:hypothetical protein
MVRMTPLRGALALVLASFTGCSQTAPDRSTTPALPPPPAAAAAPAAPAAVVTEAPAATAPPAAPRVGPIARGRPVPEIIFENVEGAEAARVRAAFASIGEHLSACHPGTNGVIRLRMVRTENGTSYTVDPSTTLDPRRRTCVLETLSIIDTDGISADTSPGHQGMGFTAHFRLEW